MRELFLRQKTTSKWFLIDIKKLNKSFKKPGRLATIIADILRGRQDEFFQPDSNNYVVLTNINSLEFSGNKLNVPKYFYHSGYLGSNKLKTPKEKGYGHAIKEAVWGCLPANRTRRSLMPQLKIFENSHNLTQPLLDFSTINSSIYEVN